MAISENPHIQSFTDYLRYEKRYSQHTIIAYQNDLAQFFTYLVSQYGGPQIRHIKPAMIRSWLAELKNEEDLGARSLNRKGSSLRSFFKHLIRTGVIENSPFTNISLPKTNKRLPVYIEEEGIETLLQRVPFDDSWPQQTARLVFMLLYGTGMRLSELVNLKESQVNTRQHTLKILGKGNKERILPVSAELMQTMTAYMERKKKDLENPDCEVLLVRPNGQKLYPKYVYLLVKQWLDNPEITTIQKKSPHVLRHSFATHLMNHGADLNAVKELLGHASLAATQVYTHNTIEKLKAAHQQAHPKA
jgi:integrase/recombinase XerC